MLVVIGILIALQVDNWSEGRNNNAKVRTILSDIMDELVSDIDKTTDIMNYYSLRDSTIFLVLNDKVSIEDYKKNEIPYLNTITSFYDRVDLTQDGYNNLTQNLDIVPDQYKSVLKNLNTLYKTDKKWVDEFDMQLGDFMNGIQEHLRENYSWFSGTNPSDWESRMEYMANNFRHKNDVHEYRTLGIGNQLRFSILYRQRAITCYREIAMLLDRPMYDESFVFNQEASGNLIGDWEVVGMPETIISFFEDEKRLYVKNKNNPGRNEVFWLPPSKFLFDNLQYGTLVKDGNEVLMRFNSFDLKKVD